jgi:hypothetical protein
LQPSYSFDNFGPKTVFPAQTISFVLLCIGPVAASSLAQSAPTSSFHWLPTPASIGTTAPPAVPLCRAPLTAALLHAQRAKPKRHHAAFTPPTKSSPSCFFFPLYLLQNQRGVKLHRRRPPPLLPFPPSSYKRPLRLGHSPPRPKPLQPSSLSAPSLLSSRANHRRHHILIAGRIPSLPGRLLPVLRTPLDPSSFPSYRGESL